MDPNNENRKVRKTPQYALYQRHNFWESNTGETPLFDTSSRPPLSHPTLTLIQLTNNSPQTPANSRSKQKPS